MHKHSPSLFSIAVSSSEPIYRQLIEQVRRLVAANQLVPGDEMPSVREIAQALAQNPMTVSKAYNLLEMDGALGRRRGLGMVVATCSGPGQPAERAACEASQLKLDPNTVLTLFATILKEAR